jgi:hypothetical protein
MLWIIKKDATDDHRWNTLSYCMVTDKSVYKHIQADNSSLSWEDGTSPKKSAHNYQPTLCKIQKSKKLTTLYWKPEISQL